MSISVSEYDLPSQTGFFYIYDQVKGQSLDPNGTLLMSLLKELWTQ